MRARTLPAVVVGDFNLDRDTLTDLARRVAGHLVIGRGVDHAIVARGTATKVDRLDTYGSDHHAILYEIAGARILAWNPWVGQRPARVAEVVGGLAAKHNPDVIVLLEAYRLSPDLADALRGYRVLHGSDVGENAEIMLLTRRDVHIEDHGPVWMRRRWTHKTNRRAPRVYRRVRVRLPNGVRLRVLGVHLPTGGIDGRNQPAVRESLRRIARWVG